MTSRNHQSWRSGLLVALATCVAAAILTAAFGIVWARGTQTPRVTVLGAGKQLSVLVTSGNARVLIAAGDKSTAFANAWSRAHPPTTRRLDVLLLAPSGQDIGFAARARSLTDARRIYVIGLLPARDAVAAGLTAIPPLPAPSRISLPGDVSITVEQDEVPDAKNPTGTDLAWRAVVRHGATAVVVLRKGADAARFPTVGPTAALIVAGDHPEEAVAAVAPRALLVSAGTISGKALRHDVAGDVDDRLWAARVDEGAVVRLDFTAGGLHFPRDGVQLLAPTPAATVGYIGDAFWEAQTAAANAHYRRAS